MNYIVKQAILGSVIAFMGMGLSGCGGAGVTPAHQAQVDQHAQMYTQSGMWAQGSSITTLNFSLGFPIPANTIVFYEDINSKQLAFSVGDVRYHLKNSPRHSKTTMDQMMDRYFATTQVDVSKFTAAEQAAIKAGKVEVGMTKEAVLVSRGYPPAHATPSLQQDEWKYWKFQKHFASDTIIYHFKDNKVSEIQD